MDWSLTREDRAKEERSTGKNEVKAGRRVNEGRQDGRIEEDMEETATHQL